MPRVLNRHRDAPTPGAVYIGRPSRWGNPFQIGRDGSREEVIQKFRVYLWGNPALLAAVRRELAGRDLLCSCKPKACHGDPLLVAANAPTPAC